jgi:Ca2+-binding RTX toxin-like protein
MNKAIGVALLGLVLTGISPLGHADGKSLPTCLGRTATIVGTGKAERIVGTPHADVIASGGGQDVVQGRGGDDRICGFEPKRLEGGPGNDRLLDRQGGFDGGVSLEGGPGNDLLIGFDGTRLRGGGGNDHLRAAGGIFAPGPGRDVVRAREPRRFDSPNTVDYQDARHYMVVDLRAGTARGQGPDRLSGIENIFGSAFGDDLRGDKGENFIDAGAGNDSMYGRAGYDSLHGFSGHDVGIAGPGIDQCDDEVELRVSCTLIAD